MAASSPDLAGRRVLVIEDEYFIADDLARRLQDRGAEVIGPVSDVSEALIQLSLDDRVDAAVLDINLHGELAYSVAEMLQQLKIPFVLATGYGAALVPAAFANVPRFEKPYDFAGLIRVLPTIMR